MKTMKTISKILPAVLLAGMVILSCSKEEIVKECECTIYEAGTGVEISTYTTTDCDDNSESVVVMEGEYGKYFIKCDSPK